MSAPRDQHFLIDGGIADRILTLTDVTDRVVLEIGPGEGILTRRILDQGARLIAIELDPVLCDTLRITFAPEIECGTLTLIQGDVGKIPLPSFEKVISNLPYSLSSKITFRILECGFREGILMYQKEFADRMLARPGTPAVGRLSIMAQTYADIERCFEVSPRAFRPMPKVRSTVLRLIPHEPRFGIANPAFYADVVRVLFSHRRKTVRNGLRSFGGALDHGRLEQILAELPGDILASRPEELQLEDFAMIANTRV